MARLIMSEQVYNDDIFVPGHIFTFGSIVLHADSADHLGRIGNFAHGQEIHFGNLEFTADSRDNLFLVGPLV